jgi:hypothetical protein
LFDSGILLIIDLNKKQGKKKKKGGGGNLFGGEILLVNFTVK